MSVVTQLQRCEREGLINLPPALAQAVGAVGRLHARANELRRPVDEQAALRSVVQAYVETASTAGPWPEVAPVIEARAANEARRLAAEIVRRPFLTPATTYRTRSTKRAQRSLASLTRPSSTSSPTRPPGRRRCRPCGC